MDNLLEQLEQWNKNDEFSRCIEAIEAIPEKERGYKLTVLLGRAYSNLAVLGDHKAHGDDDEVDKELIQHSIDILETVWKQGENDPYWNARMGYAHLMADDTAAVALEYGKRWLELEPDNPEAQKLVSDCEGYLSEEPVEMYDEADWDAVEKHIEKYFGHYDYVFHESVSTGIHLDICVIPPRKDHNYYTLVTFGMGAHRMNVPEEKMALEDQVGTLTVQLNEKDEALAERTSQLIEKQEEIDNYIAETKTYDVVLRVKPEKASQIKSQVINGQKCLVIPMGEDEHATINGVNTTV